MNGSDLLVRALRETNPSWEMREAWIDQQPNFRRHEDRGRRLHLGASVLGAADLALDAMIDSRVRAAFLASRAAMLMVPKLTLRLDDLRVDSFSPESARDAEGTVFERDQWSYQNTCGCPGTGPTCGDLPTCYISCENNTCDQTGCVACEQDTLGCNDPQFSQVYTCAATCQYSCSTSCYTC